ncbi:MAG: hypothetical protein COB67_11785, partial [SAR324 cluster bacterium]
MSKLSIGKKLFLGFGIVGILLVVLSVTGITQLTNIDDSYRFEVMPQVYHESQIATIQSQLKEARLMVMYFLWSNDEKYIALGNQALDQTIVTAVDLSKKTKDADAQGDLRQMVTSVEAYQKGYNKLVAYSQERGLNSSQGAQGELRSIAHEIEKSMKDHDSEHIYFLFLELRSVEKDLQRSNATLYQRQWTQKVAKLRTAFLESTLEQTDKDRLKQTLSRYEDQFKIWRNTSKRDQNKVYNDVRSTAASVLEILQETYFPNGQILYLTLRRHEKDYLMRTDEKYFNRALQTLEQLQRGIQASNIDQKDQREVLALFEQYRNSLKDLRAADEGISVTVVEMKDVAVGMLKFVDGVVTAEMNETKGMVVEITEKSEMARMTMLLTSIVSVIITLAFSFFFIRSITKLLVDLVNNLSSSAEQVAAASDEISRSSIQLSQGATEQAASLEETSSSMEEMASQTKDNAQTASMTATSMIEVTGMMRKAAEHAETASSFAAETQQSADNGVKFMNDLSSAMKEIQSGSDRIADIIEVINEITHQTKMLATNAAIEAARAGEQGKGFAVVADEVSKLAENSKSAAKEIGHLIKESSRKAKVGTELASQGEVVLNDILGKSSQATELMQNLLRASNQQAVKVEKMGHQIEDIKNASNEQANGVSQVSRAIVDMDQVTQSNAASSEQTA